MSGNESTVRAIEIPLDDEEVQRLETHYGHAVARMLHEYDQRDRDFVMHITINGGLFAAAAFSIGPARVAAPGSLLVAGVALMIIGFTGIYAAKALIGSVDSFKYWQGLMNATLAGLEVAILPDAKYGIWCRNVSTSAHATPFIGPELQRKLDRIEVGPARPNLVEFRKGLAVALKKVWMLVMAAGALLFVGSFALVWFPPLRQALTLMWPG